MFILQGVSIEEFFERIEKIAERKIEEKIKVEKQVAYMSRKEVAAFFKVSLPTIQVWINEVMLISYRIAEDIL